MPRSPTVYTLPPGTTPQAPNTPIGSAMFNAAMDDIATTFNTAQPIAYGGTGATSVITGWDALNAKGTDIATSGTINLTTATGPNLTLTGTTTVTTVTLAEGNMRFVRANAAFQLTASANLIINGSAASNYTTTAGDLLIFIGAASSVVRVWVISGSVQAASLAEVLAGVVSNKYVSPATAYFPTGFISSNFLLSTNASDATNDIDITAHTARDSTDSYNIIQASALVKRLDAAWAVGTNQGMLATGAGVTNTTYYLFDIKRNDTGVVDFAADTSSTGANIAANTNAAYTIIRRVGYVVRTGGVNAAPVMYAQPTVEMGGGAAPVFACRAWLNYNGSTNAILNSGNITSVTDNGGTGGDYTLNFTAPMSNANYAMPASCQGNAGEQLIVGLNYANPTKTASAVRIGVKLSGLNLTDVANISVAIVI